MRFKSRAILVAITLLAVLLSSVRLGIDNSYATSGPVLGSAQDFQIVSGAATTIGGAVTGLDIGDVSSSTTAVNDLRDAISAQMSAPGLSVASDLGGKTYLPGTYLSAGGAAFSMTSNVILDGNYDCNSIFIFITPAAMNTTAAISITLINDAQPNNVYWVASGAITTGASGTLSGNFMSSAAITVGASSIFDGRLLAMAAVTIGASVGFQGFPVTGCSAPTGSLSIAVPASVETKILTAGETLTIEIGTVVVTDTRGIASGAFWSVSTMCDGLIDGSGNTLGGENFSYSMKELSSTGGLTLTEHTLSSMVSLSQILVATSGVGINSATWIPVLKVFVPLDQLGGTYTGSIVHSVF
jgi:hypothetical protein